VNSERYFWKSGGQ